MKREKDASTHRGEQEVERGEAVDARGRERAREKERVSGDIDMSTCSPGVGSLKRDAK